MCVEQGLAGDERIAEICAGFRDFGKESSHCFALARGEAVAFKRV